MPVAPEVIQSVVQRALREDIGNGDITTQATVPPGTRARATITQKGPGVLSGLACAELAFRTLDPEAAIERLADEGVWREPRVEVMTIAGDAGAILSAERTALNLLQRLGGVATLTARYVAALEGSGTRVLDTRKTTPGLRALEKQAVLDGGGVNHRFGLFDEVLIKENHAALAGGVGNAVRQARAMFPDTPLVCEVQDLDELEAALEAGAPRVLLDNMDRETLAEAVRRSAGRAQTEASGGLSLQEVKRSADLGLDFVSVGALTHSAPALDLSLLLEPLP